jgi:two-component system OmpR family response regulator
VRALLVEDDARLLDVLGRGLRAQGYAVDTASTREDALWLARENPYDVGVIDVGLPDGDGIELCSTLRDDRRWFPILILTARQAIDDRVRGLDSGADDYVLKPFSFAELSARLRALVRREPVERPTSLLLGLLRLDPATHDVSIDGQPVDLSLREFALLEMLLRRAGQVVSRTEILEHVWDWAYDGTSNVIDVYVSYVRAELRRHAGAPEIETIRGVGYRLRAL